MIDNDKEWMDNDKDGKHNGKALEDRDKEGKDNDEAGEDSDKEDANDGERMSRLWQKWQCQKQAVMEMTVIEQQWQW